VQKAQGLVAQVMPAKNLSENTHVFADLISLFSQHNKKKTMEEILSSLMLNLNNVAESLQKPLPDLVTMGMNHHLNEELGQVFEKVFLHLMRNSIDHGIEAPAARIAKGKKADGMIKIKGEKVGTSFHISYSDDGAGLNLAAIKNKAQNLSLLTPEKKYDPENFLEIIFLPGFSTKDEASEISGRGVGMDSVRELIQSAEGEIKLVLLPHSENGFQKFEFQLKIKNFDRI
jgi:two-component system chemotaxis sensor kinase CheA